MATEWSINKVYVNEFGQSFDKGWKFYVTNSEGFCSQYVDSYDKAVAIIKQSTSKEG